MKKIIFFFFLVSTFANAQDNYFTFTIGGFVNTVKPDQDYVVIDFKEVTKKELYNSFLTYITTMYVSAKDVVNKVENEAITITAFSGKAIEYGKKRVRRKYDLQYNIQFLFKDNKVRVNKPNILGLYNLGSSDLTIYMKRNDMSLYPTIYNEDKTVRSQFSINSLEKYFNNYINNLVKVVKSNENKDW